MYWCVRSVSARAVGRQPPQRLADTHFSLSLTRALPTSAALPGGTPRRAAVLPPGATAATHRARPWNDERRTERLDKRRSCPRNDKRREKRQDSLPHTLLSCLDIPTTLCSHAVGVSSDIRPLPLTGSLQIETTSQYPSSHSSIRGLSKRSALSVITTPLVDSTAPQDTFPSSPPPLSLHYTLLLFLMPGGKRQVVFPTPSPHRSSMPNLVRSEEPGTHKHCRRGGGQSGVELLGWGPHMCGDGTGLCFARPPPWWRAGREGWVIPVAAGDGP